MSTGAQVNGDYGLPKELDYSEYDTRLASYLVLTRGDEVLLSHWTDGPRPLWTMPGGGTDLGESLEDGAVREVWEETGYRARAGRLLAVDTFEVPAEERFHNPRGVPLRCVRVIYAGEIVGGQLRREENGSTDEARWFPLAQVAELDRVPLVDISLRAAGLLP
ncbi:NUDIX hydrolase [Dermabacteraceae bacterium P13095]